MNKLKIWREEVEKEIKLSCVAQNFNYEIFIDNYKVFEEDEDGERIFVLRDRLATIKKATKIFEEMIDEDKIYPKDIFLEVSKFQLETINDLLVSHLGFPLDRLSGHIGRELLKGFKQKLKEARK